MNEAFIHYQRTGIPFVTLKAAMTLDGKIATRTGDSQWITGPKARRYVHLQRARSGAVMVGIGTLLADNAQLAARLPGVALPRQPLRIVVDSQPPHPSRLRRRSPRHSRSASAHRDNGQASIRNAAQALLRPGSRDFASPLQTRRAGSRC